LLLITIVKSANPRVSKVDTNIFYSSLYEQIVVIEFIAQPSILIVETKQLTDVILKNITYFLTKGINV
jgi:hypothetical protein